MKQIVTLLLIAILGLVGCDGSGGDNSKSALRIAIEGDMFLPHEGIPSGVTVAGNEFDWKYAPRLAYGANMPEGWSSIQAWGQVYAEENHPTPDVDFPDARVQIRNLQLYIYRHDGTWIKVQDRNQPVGSLYVEDFANDIVKEPDLRLEEDGISVKAGSGYNFHFFPPIRESAYREEIAGVFVVCQARLIGEYDAPPHYIMSVGGDYWKDNYVEWLPDYSHNGDIGIGRFKYITDRWQYFTMHTFTAEELKDITFPGE